MTSSAPEDAGLMVDWLTANLWGALVVVVADMATEVIDPVGGAFASERNALVGFVGALALQLAAGAAYAVLSGQVLRRLLPVFPMRAWIALHATIVALVYLGRSA